MATSKSLEELEARVLRGGPERHHEKGRAEGKLFARERLARLLDEGSFVEEGRLANCAEPELPADGVITGMGRMAGRAVALIANDSTVKAGSWGRRTVEKILRMQESAERQRVPLLYLIDSAGARITDQLEMFPGRRGAGRIFFNQVRLSGKVPQLCLLFGPSAAGGAYIPAFCDATFMVEGNASMYLGSPRMAEMVIGEKVTLEEMGGARMHCTISGCGDLLCASEEEALAAARRYLGFMPQSCSEPPPLEPASPPERQRGHIEDLIPSDQNVPFDMHALLRALVDEGSLFELKALYAGELLTLFARIEGRPVGIVASQPKVKGGVLFVESAQKGARFIQLCDAFNLPILYLADVPGFMIGTKVERAGIIRAGARMVSAVSEATVPRICVVLRKAYGAGLYAMGGPAFEPDATIALPGALIAVMGAEAAVNAVYFNRLRELAPAQRAEEVKRLRAEYNADVDIMKLASELVVDAVVSGDALRGELARRLALLTERQRLPSEKKHAVAPA